MWGFQMRPTLMPGEVEQALVRAGSLRRASAAPYDRSTRSEQPDDRARCFCVSRLIHVSLARTPAFRGKMPRVPNAFFNAFREDPRRPSLPNCAHAFRIDRNFVKCVCGALDQPNCNLTRAALPGNVSKLRCRHKRPPFFLQRALIGDNRNTDHS